MSHNSDDSRRDRHPVVRHLLAHRDGVLSILLVTLACCWMASYATWELLGREAFGAFYDAQAKSLLHGHWNVPHEPDSLHTEGFLRDGKWYGYFGFFPAVLRVPLVLTAPGMDGRWCRISVVIAVTLSAAYAYLVLLLARRMFGLPAALDRASRSAYAMFVLAAGIGSTSIFLASRTFPHHEALAWGGALALASFYHLLRFMVRPDHLGQLIASGGFAFASFFSRATVGGGAVLALLLLAANIIVCRLGAREAGGGASGLMRTALAPLRALCRWSPETSPPLRAAVVAVAVVAITAATFVGINYAKFGTVLDSAPIWRHEDTFNHPQRLARTGGKLMSAGNVRTVAYNFFFPTRLEFRPTFPWVFATRTLRVFPEARLDDVETYGSVPATMPFLFAGAVVGLVCLRRKLAPRISSAAVDADADRQPVNSAAMPTVALIGALAGGMAVLPINYVTHRYLHDFFPFLVLAAAFGLHVMLALRGRLVRAIAFGAAALALLFSIYASCALAVVYQRMQVWGVPRERRIAFWHTRYTMDKHVSRAFFSDMPLPSAP